jgi:hypothetical protein
MCNTILCMTTMCGLCAIVGGLFGVIALAIVQVGRIPDDRL